MDNEHSTRHELAWRILCVSIMTAALCFASTRNGAMASPASSDDTSAVTFRLELVRDVMVEHNPVWVRLGITNRSDSELRIRNLSRILDDDIIDLRDIAAGPVQKQSVSIAFDDPMVGPRDSLIMYIALDNFGSASGSPHYRYLPAARYHISIPVYTTLDDKVTFNVARIARSLTVKPLDIEYRHIQRSIAMIEQDTSDVERWKTLELMIHQNSGSPLIPRLLKSMYDCAVADHDPTALNGIARSFQKLIQRYPDDPASIDMLRWIAKVNEYGDASEVTASFLPFLRILAKKHGNRLVGDFASYTLDRFLQARSRLLTDSPAARTRVGPDFGK